jgi:hypothetical protein
MLRIQCFSLKSKVPRTTSADPTWYFREAEILTQAAQDLLEAAQQLEARGQHRSQPSLPLERNDIEGTSVDATGFKLLFPDLEDEDAEEVLAAYERITRLSPSIVLFPKVLQAEIRQLVRVDADLCVEQALILLNFEQAVRTLNRGTDKRDALIEFYDQLRARLIALHAEGALTDDAFAQLHRFLDASKSLFAPI